MTFYRVVFFLIILASFFFARPIAAQTTTTDPAQSESTSKESSMSFSGDRELKGKGEGYMRPLKSWVDNGLQCYYGQYYWRYPTGTTEVGNIPWPFCFEPANDPIARHVRQFPFPLPMRGYQLPAGTYLYPIEKAVYDVWLAHQQVEPSPSPSVTPSMLPA
jgi:hypothetical protein